MKTDLHQSPIALLVGLGNPGVEYANTRHNAGAWLVDQVASKYSAPLSNEKKFFGHVGRLKIDTIDCHLLIPSTFMNLSGQAVAAVMQFYKIPSQAVLVAHDELDIDPGTIRLKSGGGHGGHNGLRDIIRALSNQKEFHRLRVGIGHPGDSRKVTNFVLGKPALQERRVIDAAIDETIQYLPDILSGDRQKVMNQLHRFDARA